MCPQSHDQALGDPVLTGWTREYFRLSGRLWLYDRMTHIYDSKSSHHWWRLWLVAWSVVKLLSEPLLVCCQLGYSKQISVKFETQFQHFITENEFTDVVQQNVGHFVSAPTCTLKTNEYSWRSNVDVTSLFISSFKFYFTGTKNGCRRVVFVFVRAFKGLRPFCHSPVNSARPSDAYGASVRWIINVSNIGFVPVRSQGPVSI